jgi:DnaJ-class molecular chaperone
MIAILLKNLGPEKLGKIFFSLQVFIVAVIVAGIYFLTRKRDESGFKVREADVKKAGKAKGPDLLGGATIKKKEAPLRLEGIRIDGAPHEVLGISRSATEEKIQSAYKDLMKRYHPDKVGRPGTREWDDAQKIAEALNTARKSMIDAVQSQSPKRSGR